MKIVALLSGGKDSCYNLVHCVRNHHEIIAAASLGPEKGKGDSSIKEPDQNADRKSPEELDSYLYQTVGQDAIEFVAQALDLPLYRKVISGSAVEQSGEYGSREPSSSGNSGIQGDETEDLYDLLRTVKVLELLN
jgi:diphthine-ammonia ligase